MDGRRDCVQRDGGRKSRRCCRREADLVGDLESDCCAGNREVEPIARAVGQRDVVQERRGVQEFAVDVDVVDQPEGCSECVAAEGVVEERGVEMGDSMRLGDAGEDRRGRRQPIRVEITASPPVQVCGHGDAACDAARLRGDDRRDHRRSLGGGELPAGAQ
jgi:hypothetical protein